jgi:hypothetical protein
MRVRFEDWGVRDRELRVTERGYGQVSFILSIQ